MDINTYKLFVTVAETANISHSAILLGYTQSGISHSMKRMENEFGFKLFIRDRYGVHLTPVGNELLPKIRKLLTINEQVEQFVSDVHGIETGTLNIGTFPSISIHWLPKILNNFHKNHPQIQIHLKEGGTNDLYNWVQNRQIDFALYNLQPDQNIEFLPIKKDEFLALFPLDYPLDKNITAYPVKAFESRPFILSEPNIDHDIQQLLFEQHVTPNILYSSRDDYAIMSMVENNLGISILPELMISQRKKYLKTLPLDPPCFRELGIGLKSFANASPAAQKFIYYILEYFNISTLP
ncbi:MAG: LysR family transcriptional regulator [Lachnospiraceae bacterium]|nr:LysR family transcriptional regulator [Lachnospiraceae bacterium]